MKPVFFLLLFAALTAAAPAFAQGWERLYTPGYAYDFTETPDGGFLLAGDYDRWDVADRAWLQKTDALGNVEWTRRYAVGDTLENYVALELAGSQHIVAAGDFLDYWTPTQPEHWGAFIHLLDVQGNLLQELQINPTPNLNKDYQTADVAVAPDGTVYHAVNVSDGRAVLYAYAPAGLQQLWSASLPVKINQLATLSDGSLLLSGAKNGLVYLRKSDASGALLWEKTYEAGSAWMTTTQNGHIVLAKSGRLLRTDAGGNLLWSKAGVSGGAEFRITEDHQGNLLATGGFYNANFTYVFTLSKFDADGNKIWDKTPHQSLQGAQSYARPLVTADGGYALAGQRNGKTLLMRSGVDFDLYRSWIAGSMFHDLDDDCVQDPGEKAQRHFYASATDANGTAWLTPVKDGKFALQTPPGTYQINISKRSYDPENWLPCDGQSVTVASTIDTAHTPAIGVRSLVDCPRPYIRAAIPKVRSCYEGRYDLQFFNFGTQKATDVRIEVELAEELTYAGSSLPLLSQNGQRLVFDAGTLDIDGEGAATIDVFCSCDAAIGDYLCSAFRILPDTCYPVLPDWDHSIIQIDAEYDATQLTYTLQNIGSGDMTQPRWYRLRNTCLNIVGSGNFQLDAGETLTLQYPNQAVVYYFEAEPAPNQPYTPGSAVLLSRCQPGPVQEKWAGNSAGSPFYDLDCMEVSNSFDPNDIRVTPRGDGADGAILADEPELRYMIRFQNTGNDTAYVVSIRDTLPVWLDALSVVPGPSSHRYAFDLQNNVLKFHFAGINLPDSTTNLDASQGYVEFSVRMKPGLAPGTRIENRAAIYFDFNAPILTNTALNTIANPILVSVDEAPRDQALLPVRVSPNPAVASAVFRFEETAEGQLLLFDAGGRQIRQAALAGAQLELNCHDLAPGIYFFRILTADGKTAQGKLVKQ